MTKFRRQFNKDYKGSKGTVNNQPSHTRPDMSIGIKQLLINHTRGIHSDVKNYEGIFTDQEIPTFDDITDQDSHKQHLIDTANELELQIKAEKKQKALERAEKKKLAEKQPIIDTVEKPLITKAVKEFPKNHS